MRALETFIFISGNIHNATIHFRISDFQTYYSRTGKTEREKDERDSVLPELAMLWLFISMVFSQSELALHDDHCILPQIDWILHHPLYICRPCRCWKNEKSHKYSAESQITSERNENGRAFTAIYIYCYIAWSLFQTDATSYRLIYGQETSWWAKITQFLPTLPEASLNFFFLHYFRLNSSYITKHLITGPLDNI